ncbi:MAG: TVP38/TMEM64 family protein [Actinomycetes bacterium]|nr:TVP38/TMEM64 family protein [Acidimicrobiia bacterium]
MSRPTPPAGDTSPDRADEKRSRLVPLLAAGLVLVVAGLVTWWGWPYIGRFLDAEEARRLVQDAGPWGPLVLIGMQIVQIVIAPIPGQITGLIGGYLFGPVLGVVYTTIGATIGFTLVFLLARRWGRPFVERFVSREHLERFDHLAGRRGTLALFLVFLLPAFPDDMISFVAGLTPIPMRTLVLVSLAGRLPGYVLLSLGGDGLAYDNLDPVVVIGAVVAVAVALAYWKRDRLHEMVSSGDVVGFLRRRWPLSPSMTVVFAVGLVLVTVALYRAATVPPLR